MKWLFTYGFFFISVLGFSIQDGNVKNKIDSIQTIISDASHDSIVIKCWTEWSNLIYMTDSELDLQLNQKILHLSNKNLKKKLNIKERRFFKSTKADALNIIGNYYYAKANYEKALPLFRQSLEIRISLNEIIKIPVVYNNIGLVYLRLGDYANAIEYYYKALNYQEKAGNKIGMGDSYNQIGVVQKDNREFKAAKEHFRKAIQIFQEVGDDDGLAFTYNNLAATFSDQNELDSALFYFLKSLEHSEKTQNPQALAGTYSNIGKIYEAKKDFTKALEQYQKGFDIRLSIDEKIGIINSLIMIGQIQVKLKNYSESRAKLNEGIREAKKAGLKQDMMQAYHALMKLDSITGNWRGAFENHLNYVKIRDSVFNEENTRNRLHSEVNFQFKKKEAQAKSEREKREALAKAEQQRKDEINAEEKRRQQTVIILVSLVLVVVIVFSIYIFKNLHYTRNQKRIIEEQKELVEEKHKEITDSINYAERIQRSFLASRQMLEENLKDYFILFRPKDVVSGDFYWTDKLSNGNFLIAAADSTGHGVPGAIMSILNITSLENAVKEGATNPADILNHTRKNIIERLKKDGSVEGGKDGMDCSLLSFDFSNHKLNFALANNPLWLIRNNELIEFKADKMPVGKHDRDSVSFNNHEIDLQKGDRIFIFTDGFADQFGGEKGKKFKYVNLQKLLLENVNLELETLNLKLSSAFTEWKGDLEQVDDVCIIGIRI